MDAMTNVQRLFVCEPLSDTAMASDIPAGMFEVEPMIACTLDVHRANSEVMAAVTFENTTGTSARFPHWTLVSDGKMTWHYFEVTREGQRVPYHCIFVKRGVPTEDEMLAIDGHHICTSRTKVSECYDFTIPGVYRINYRSYTGRRSDHVEIEIVSNIVTLVVE